MPKGRKPNGPQAMTGAERQARFRARQALANSVPARPERRKSAGEPRRSRPQRWRAAVTELLSLQAEYVAWLDALPEPTRDSATGEALQAIADLDLDEIAAIDPPRGFGRD